MAPFSPWAGLALRPQHPEDTQGGPKSQQEAGAAEQGPPATAPQKPDTVHMEPVGPPTPAGPQDAKPSCAHRLAPEGLDASTLRLLWGQRDLELQALRWAVWNQEARHCRILQEVAGLPPERSRLGQERLLQNQVQKLSAELKEEKERAERVKAHLEQRLQHALGTLQQLEAQLHVFQKSCLLQLARASWVGCTLRSSTGSLEVVTAETLLDPNDHSDDDQAPSTGELFRLEDVDWNRIAHRYPNLFSDIQPSSEQKPPRPAPDQLLAGLPAEDGSWKLRRHKEQRLKSVEWCSLPLAGGAGSGSVGSADTDSSGSQREAPHSPRKGPLRWRGPKAAAEPQEAQAQPEGLSLGLQKARSDLPGKTVSAPQSTASADPQDPRHQHGLTGSCLRIVAVSRRERFVRILNQSLEETAELGGLVLQQRVGAARVCTYRFPPCTQLAPRHHVTVWGEGPARAKKQLPPSLRGEPVLFHSGPGCVTLLLSPKGEVLSEHRAPHCVTPASRIFTDDTDLSIDRFPISEAQAGADASEQSPAQEAPSRRRRKPGTRVLLPRLGASEPARPREAAARPEHSERSTDAHAPQLLPLLPETALRLEALGAGKEPTVRVGRKSVDRGFPMVALSVQNTAESRFGFRFLSCPPITADACGRVRGRCGLT